MSLTVRTKLAVLVGSPLVLICAAMPLLYFFQHRELTDAADDQVEVAERAFQAEADDDLGDVVLAAEIISRSSESREAIVRGHADDALAVARVFAKLYPGLDLIIAQHDGRVLGDVGPTEAPANLKEIPELGGLNGPMQVTTAQGCTKKGGQAPPSHAVLAPVGSVGWVLACDPLDADHLANAAAKLGVELALLQDGQVRASTRSFPVEARGIRFETNAMIETRDRVWSVHRFAARTLQQTKALRLDIVAAVDITKTSRSVHRYLWLTIGGLLLVATLAILASARVAGAMSRGLKLIIEAYKQLAQQIYVKVPVIKTRDEIELLAEGFNRMVEGLKERDKLRTTFGKYMTGKVLDHLLHNKVELGGKTLPVTVLFSDIRSFTTISETMDAHELVALLNEYFTAMVTIVTKHDGVIDKYIGDAIMAVFGAPVPSKEDAANAVRAAVEMRQALADLNRRLTERGMQTLRTGIGIHSGEVVAGNIGSEQRMEYTVIGDPVNVASRLESSTKELGVDVLISDATYQRCKGVAPMRAVSAITVKGRVEPIMTYEVLPLESPLPEVGA